MSPVSLIAWRAPECPGSGACASARELDGLLFELGGSVGAVEGPAGEKPKTEAMELGEDGSAMPLRVSSNSSSLSSSRSRPRMGPNKSLKGSLLAGSGGAVGVCISKRNSQPWPA